MNSTNTEFQTSFDQDDEISIIDLLIVIGQYKRFIAIFTLACGLIAAAVSLMLTPVFTAKTVFMPPQQQASTASSLLSSLGGLSGLAGGVAGIKSPEELYISLMKSDGVLKLMVEQFNLKEHYKTENFSDTKNALASHFRVTSDKKSGLLTVEVDDHDSVFAANMANAFVKNLGLINDRLAVTDAQQRRLFFETQIVKTQEKLAKTEALFRDEQGRSGFQMPSINADTSLKNIAELHGQIAAREIQLQAIDRFATLQNPEVQRLTSELSAMRSTLQKLERGSGTPAVGTIQQEAMAAYRDLKTQESMLEAFVKQLELARVDEAKEGPLLQVVDTATPPDRRSSPKRALIVLISLLAGLFLSLLFVLIHNTISKSLNDPESEARFKRLLLAWSI